MALSIVASIGALLAGCTDVGLAILIGAMLMTIGGAVTCLIEAGVAEDTKYRRNRLFLGVFGLLIAGGVGLSGFAMGAVGACGGVS